MSHTPGPWRAVETDADGHEFYILPDGDSPAIASGLIGRGRRIEESRADAQLLAAAPDLLEACKAALGAFEHNNAIDWNDLSRAIEKAEGK